MSHEVSRIVVFVSPQRTAFGARRVRRHIQPPGLFGRASGEPLQLRHRNFLAPGLLQRGFNPGNARPCGQLSAWRWN